MSQELKILFIDKLKRPDTENKFVRGLLFVLTIPFYPIVLVFGLLVMFFIWLFYLWQKLTSRKEDLQKQNEVVFKSLRQNYQWRNLISSNKILIEQKLAGSLPWDSGDYLYLKSNPPIPYLVDKLFGDWFHIDFGGVFLQKWNHPKNINCDLIFINFDTFKVTHLKKGLPTKDWTTEKINSDEIKFTFITADTDFTYIVRQTTLT